MGCGTRIPSIRQGVANLATSISKNGNGDRVTLVRLNPDELYKSYDYPKTYRVETKALSGLALIDKYITGNVYAYNSHFTEKLADKNFLPLTV